MNKIVSSSLIMSLAAFGCQEDDKKNQKRTHTKRHRLLDYTVLSEVLRTEYQS